MTHAEKRVWLIRRLLEEGGHENPIPESPEEQRRLLRALMNVRPPMPAGDDFLAVQDAYLRERVAEKGVVDAAGDGEYSVAIRSGVFDGHAGWVYAGCGIVAGSDAASEYDEIDMKLKTITSGFDAPAD